MNHGWPTGEPEVKDSEPQRLESVLKGTLNPQRRVVLVKFALGRKVEVQGHAWTDPVDEPKGIPTLDDELFVQDIVTEHGDNDRSANPLEFIVSHRATIARPSARLGPLVVQIVRVIVTTSRLLSTGVDAQVCKVTVLDQGTIRARAFQQAAPKEILFRANRTLIRRAVEGLYCALTYAVFDFQANEVRIANSGLPYPMHFKASQKKAAPIELPGIPLGLFDNVVYDEAMIPIESGDVFVFYSDGVTEAWNGKEEFGSARLAALVAKHAHKSAREIGREVEKSLRAWAKQHLANDDVTLVVVRVT